MTRFETVPFRKAPIRARQALVFFASVFGACTPLEDGGSSISRGDQAFAHGDLEEALAEYRLAETQGAADAGTFSRIAHTYVALRRIDEARDYYRRAVEDDSFLADQAAADFVRLAREERRRRDDFGMASAVQTALEFRPGISLEDLALPLARHYANIGEHGRALPFYQKTLSALSPDSLPELLFEAAIAYDEVGDCESAVLYYEDYRNGLPRWQRGGEVDWRMGNCSFQLARVRRAEGDEEEALRHLETLLRLGEPRSLLAMGYYEKGEILGYRGECEAAVEAFEQVPVVDPSGTSPLVSRAEERVDQIRFGRRLDRPFQLLRPGEAPVSCFPGETDPSTRRRRG
ncbi:tetratricopeptide repeat protein [Gemmatimonadota bacterium]